MHRIFFQNPIIGNRIAIEDVSEIKHLAKVLRAEAGYLFEVCSSSGEIFVVEVESVSDTAIEGRIISFRDAMSIEKTAIDLFQAVPKKNNMDIIVQKNTELGINSIRPYTSSRTIVKIDEKNSDKKTQRWSRVAKEAAKQSKRTDIPEIAETVSFKEMLLALNEYDRVILLYESEKRKGFECIESMEGRIKNIALIVGPEGGFSTKEVADLKERGAISISLGPRILRTETAGFAALSIVQYIFGDMKGA